MAKERSRADASSIKGKDPDRGPSMIEGAHHYDKGYDSDEDVFDRNISFPDDMERGNSYVKMAKEMVSRDSKKLNRSKFSKIA